MAKCRNDVVMSMISNKQLTKTQTVKFDINEPIDACVKEKTKNYIEFEGENAMYRIYSVPQDELNCHHQNCINTGTLFLDLIDGDEDGNQNAHGSAKYSISSNALNYASGVIYYYAYFPTNGTYTLNSTISDMSDVNQVNSDTYSQTIEVTDAPSYKPIYVDLSKMADTINGTGWVASESGIILNIEIENETTTTNATAGISSIFVFESIEDFEVNDVVEIGCLETIDDTSSFDLTDSYCFGVQYDESTISIEKTITGRSATANYFKLNPMIGKGEETEGYATVTIKDVVKETTINGIDYGYIQTTDMYVQECGFTKVSIDDNCNVTDAELVRVSTPVPIELDEKQFIVLDGTKTNVNDAGKILVNEEYIGKTLIVTYPKRAEVEHWVIDENNINNKRVRMTYEMLQNDGVRTIYTYNNVYITSFPTTLSNTDETTFEFTISIIRDENGRFGDVKRVI